MITILAAALMLQVPVRDAGQLNPEDARQIVNAVLDKVLPPDSSVGSPAGLIRIASRPIFLDAERTTRAFREELIPEMPDTLAALERVGFARRDDVISCVRGVPRERAPSCSIARDGFYTAITNAAPSNARGEYLIDFLALWGARTRLIGFEMQLFVGKVDAQWRVLRYGTAKAF